MAADTADTGSVAPVSAGVDSAGAATPAEQLSAEPVEAGQVPVAAALRRFGWEQMPALAQMWVASWQEAMPEIDFEPRRGWLCQRVEQLLAAGARIETLVDAAGRPLGFVTVDPASGYVDQLVVHPDHWGHGFARQLLAAAAGHAPAGLTLDVNEENRRAVRFYEAAGFTATARGANPTSGRPTLRMERRPAE